MGWYRWRVGSVAVVTAFPHDVMLSYIDGKMLVILVKEENNPSICTPIVVNAAMQSTAIRPSSSAYSMRACPVSVSIVFSINLKLYMNISFL